MQHSPKTIAVMALIGTVTLTTMVRLVATAQSQAPVTIMPIHPSVYRTAKANDQETNDDVQEQANEQQESKKLQPLAKITAQQAQKIAEAFQGKTSRQTKLENDNGNLVYAVDFGQKEVKVDAGNGRVLYTERRNDREAQEHEASNPRSSIQINEAIGSDGDGETNDDGDANQPKAPTQEHT